MSQSWILDRITAWIHQRLGIRSGDQAWVNSGGHGWTKPVAPPRDEDRPK